MRTRLGLRRLTRDSERVDRSFQTAARVKGTGTLAKPACPPNGIASDALAARPEGDTASGVSSCGLPAQREVQVWDNERGDEKEQNHRDRCALREVVASEGCLEHVEGGHVGCEVGPR